ncbi:MAG: MATE family efflux transporter [Acutalibacteraceae bacterium]|jgi:putative MATE family efflux protein
MIKKLFRQMLLTQILSAMTVMICMLIDSIMIGRFLGVDSMTAYGLASPVLMVFAAIGSMLSAGIQVMCGKAMGSGDRKATDSCFSVSMFIVGLVSAIGLILVLVFTAPLATLLGAGQPTPDNAVFWLTQDYLRGFIIGAPAFLCAQIMVPYMQMSGNQTRMIVAVAAMTVSDVAFDLLNVLAVKGGMFGMGLASSLSYYIALAIGIVYFFKKDCLFRFRFKELRRQTAGRIFGYGMPTVVNQVSLVLLVYLFNQILLQVGQNTAVAAYSVISTVGNVCYAFCFGVGSVALMLSSIFYTDEDRTALRSLVKTMVYFAVVLHLAVTGATLLAARPLVGLFLADDPATAELAAWGLRLFSLSLLPSALNTAFKNYFQGINRTGYTYAISVMQNFAFMALFGFVLSRFIGTTGVWLAFVCGETATLLVLCAMVWIDRKKIRLSADVFTMLPADFGAREDECLETTIRTVEESVEASKKAEAFCLAHGESPRDSMFIGLCVEEMADNIVEHGFTKDKKDHVIELRLMFKENNRVIRIRDNCVRFDPVQYLELHKTDDPAAHVGIRMVMAMVKDATYVNTLGLNNLTLVL